MPSRGGRKFVARVQDLGQNELDCHAYGHAWSPQLPEQRFDSAQDQVVWVQEINCLRCPKVRTDVMEARSFRKVGRSHYTEPEHFRVLEPVVRGRVDYKREAIQRMMSQQRSESRAHRFQGT